MDIRGGSAQQLIIVGFVGVLLAACGGGGGSGNGGTPPPPAADTQAPTAKIYFPTEQALTTAERITVTGSATDPQGNTISSVMVNGSDATSSDAFATWTASVVLQPGENTITVETADDQGNSDASATSITVINEVVLLNPRDIVTDSAGSRALLVDDALRAVIAVDLTTGQRSTISGNGVGGGASFSAPASIALDSANNRAFVTDGSLVIEVDLASGDRSQFADISPVKTGGTQALDIALDESNNRLLIVDLVVDINTAVDGVIAVSLVDGAASDFSSANLGSGAAFNAPVNIVIDTTGNRALVTDSAGSEAAVIEVDLVDGSRNTIASTSIGTGTNLEAPLGITLSSDGRALVTDLGNGAVPPMIVAIDLTSLQRTVVSGGDGATGSGTILGRPIAIAADSANNRSLVLDSVVLAVFRVDETSGNRETVSSSGAGNGTVFEGPIDIEFDAANDRALVTDNGTNTNTRAIYTVNLDTGERTILSDNNTGTGPDLEFPFGLAVDDTEAFVTDIDAVSVFSVDLASGNRTLLTSDFGASTKSPQGIALDSSSNTLYLTVVERNATSGRVEGSELFSLPTSSPTATPFTLSGVGANLNFAQSVAVDSDAGTAFVADTLTDELFAVTLAGGATSSQGRITNTIPEEGLVPFQDLTLMGGQAVLVDSLLASVVAIDNSTGDRIIISGDTTGDGVALQGPSGVAYAPDRNVLLVVDRLSFAVFAVEPTSGDRVIISR